jgi:WhiB family redox-sensing transcriptional regulator
VLIGTEGLGLIVTAKVMVWRELGACRGLDPGLFFPDEDEEANTAKSVCEQCVVRIVCLEHALASREKQGVWGGATERERRRIIRYRRRSA